MIELVLSMMLWIHNVTGYTIPEPPNISLVSKEMMLSYAYGCELDPIPEENIELCDTRKDWNLSEDGPLGMYDHVKRAIIMPDDFDINRSTINLFFFMRWFIIFSMRMTYITMWNAKQSWRKRPTNFKMSGYERNTTLIYTRR